MAINGVNFTGNEQKSSANRTLRHVGNMALTTGGVVGTAYAVRKAAKSMTKTVLEQTDVVAVGFQNGLVSGKWKVVDSKLGKAFKWLGEKIFNTNNKVYGKQLEKFQKYLTEHNIMKVENFAKAKASAALLLVGGAVALGFIVNGIYKAGKIDADK